MLSRLLTYPIIQGPMAGGASTAQLVAAVSNAGGLGSLAAGMLAPAAIGEQVRQIRALTARPFAINLFVQQTPTPSEAELQQAEQWLKPVWSALGWDGLPRPPRWCEDFSAQFEALIDAAPALASFTFDILSQAQVTRLQAAGIVVVGTATQPSEALAWQALGVDAVCLSGGEAGGHRGTFIGPQEDVHFSTMELLALCLPQLRVPAIVAGNIMDGHDIAAALAAGAAAVQMGTAFLVTPECGIDPAYQQRLLSATTDCTRQTRAITGRLARGLDNRFMQAMEAVAAQVPAYPVQNALTAGLRSAAAKLGDTELMSLWAGQGVARARAMPAAQLLALLVAEAGL